jgi:hypothetical protein
MPLIPATRPFNSISSTEASPINPPPSRPDTGSNAAIDYPLPKNRMNRSMIESPIKQKSISADIGRRINRPDT